MARKLMAAASEKTAQAQALLAEAADMYERAEALTYRASPVRRAAGVSEIITKKMRDQVFFYADHYPDMTTSEIAIKAGLRNMGRVSEILRGKR
jgi:hypothetical protein